MNATGTLGWAVIGCGWVARDYVIPAIEASSNGRVVALCDPDVRALAAAAPQRAVLRTTSLDQALAAEGVEAAYVATPNHLHAEIVRRCAAAGLPVLCEKPMARTVEEAETMVEACERAGVLYATAFDQRFHPAHQRLRALIAEGALGTVTLVRIHYACWTPPEWAPDALSTDNWRMDPTRAGGGATIDLAPHGIDLTQTLLDEPLVDLACLLQRRIHPYNVDDGGVIIGRTTSGALLSHSVAYNCPDAFERRRLEVVGTRGRALAVNTMGQTPGGRLTLTDALSGVEREVAFDTAASPFQRQVEAFAAAVLGERPFPFAPERDLHTMRLLDAAGREGTHHLKAEGALT